LSRLTRGGVHTLWILFRSKDSQSDCVFAIAPGAHAGLPWKFVQSSRLTLPVQNAVTRGSNILQATTILKEVLTFLDLVVPPQWLFIGLSDLQKLQENIKYKERELFTPIDVASPNHFLLKEDMQLALTIQGFKDVALSIEQVKSLQSDLAKHFEAMENSMGAVAKQMSGDTEKLERIWNEKLDKLQQDLSKGSEIAVKRSMDQIQ